MPFLWLEVDDPPGPMSDRGRIEAGSIALLGASKRLEVDDSSTGWLGRHANRNLVCESGLWNVNHVQDEPDDKFLNVFEHHLVRAIA
jgi:hypothetical protein